MIGAEANRRNGVARGRGGWARGPRCRVKGRCRSRRERSNSDRKFLYGVQCAAHSQLEARNRLVFANRARPTSRRATRAVELRWYFEGRALSQFSATFPRFPFRDFHVYRAAGHAKLRRDRLRIGGPFWSRFRLCVWIIGYADAFSALVVKSIAMKRVLFSNVNVYDLIFRIT